MKLKVILLTTILAGCATYKPVVDLKNTDSNTYTQDVKECEVLANKVVATTSKYGYATASTLYGAAIGGLVGGVDNIGTGAGIGAATGIIGSWVYLNRVYTNAYRNCLIFRGYTVLN